MNDSILTVEILRQVRKNMLEVARREYKENGFIWFNGRRYHIDKTQIPKEIREEKGKGLKKIDSNKN